MPWNLWGKKCGACNNPLPKIHDEVVLENEHYKETIAVCPECARLLEVINSKIGRLNDDTI